ncbi:hypothetical protein IPV09_01510 [Tessaracoccus sp. SD287]|uniref:hypothetical protein n=1 Tax=Tessaracoccus sp. SD287 TaxID=2782008 RepID=UPI001A964B1A|nr:hypothetical protein [Tessaracoccus sp. SD287]MBO1030008.1 hypothetical protein [Tessaracoccus sp. SD287]
MRTVPLRSLVDVSRLTVQPSEMGESVLHFSIPALDQGEPVLVPSADIDSHKLRLQGGEILISRLNPRIPRVHIVPRTLPFESVASTEFVALNPRPAADPDFTRYFLLSSAVRGRLHSEVRSATRSHQRVDPDVILQLRVPKYGHREQRRIADFLDDRVARIDQIIAARRDQIRAIDEATRSELCEGSLYSKGPRVQLRRLIQGERLGIWGSNPGEEVRDISVARVADFNRHDFTLGPTQTIRSATDAQVDSRLLLPGDVLLERSGGTQLNPVGCPAYVVAVEGPVVCSNFVSRLRPKEGVDGRYLSLVLGALYATRQQSPHSTQTTGIMNLNTGSYFKVLIPLRSPQEMSELGRRLDRALAAAREHQGQLNRSIELLTEYKSSLITAAVTGELDVATASRRIPGE